MRLIKQQTTNLRRIQPSSKGVKQDMDDQIVMVSERALRVPVGTLPQRPGSAGIATSSAIAMSGMLYRWSGCQLSDPRLCFG